MTDVPNVGSDVLADELLALACRLAVEAGGRALAGRRGEVAAAMTTATKSSTTDLVTVHDRAAEATIVEGLKVARPDDGIVGEEGTNHPGTSGVSWYVDPIDGTTNFVYDLPSWATSIAARDGEGTLVGAVYLPVLGELFAAARGRGATLDGRPLTCSPRDDLSLALVATGFGYAPERRLGQAALLQRLIGSIRDIRRFGSAAMDLCYVAAGRFDAFYELGLAPWDMAAGELIAREAGCRTGDFAGGPVRFGASGPGVGDGDAGPSQLLAASPAIFDGMAALLSG